jgi:hypothetical protein
LRENFAGTQSKLNIDIFFDVRNMEIIWGDEGGSHVGFMNRWR